MGAVSVGARSLQYGTKIVSIVTSLYSGTMKRGSLAILLPFLALAQARLDLSAADEPVPADYFSLASLFDEDNLLGFDVDQGGEDNLLFPTLNKDQQRFAVNPAYPGYTANVFGNPTDSDSSTSEVENDEVVDDPFVSSDLPKFPKKASLKALLEEDPRVIANAIEDERINDIYFTTIVGVTSGLTVFVIVGAGFLYHRAWKNAKAAEDVEYPAYGVTGPGKDTSPTSGDRKLAQNAQLYHYQHQKQQMIAFDTHAEKERRNGNVSDNESDDGEEGDYTVYECPGLAPTGEMEVRNPMFEDDATPKATK